MAISLSRHQFSLRIRALDEPIGRDGGGIGSHVWELCLGTFFPKSGSAFGSER